MSMFEFEGNCWSVDFVAEKIRRETWQDVKKIKAWVKKHCLIKGDLVYSYDDIDKIIEKYKSK